MLIYISTLIQAIMCMGLNFITSTRVCLCFSAQEDVCAGLRISLRHEYDFLLPASPTPPAGHKRPSSKDYDG